MERTEHLEPVMVLRNQQVAGSIPAGGSSSLNLLYLPTLCLRCREDFSQHVDRPHDFSILLVSSASNREAPGQSKAGFSWIQNLPTVKHAGRANAAWQGAKL